MSLTLELPPQFLPLRLPPLQLLHEPLRAHDVERVRVARPAHRRRFQPPRRLARALRRALGGALALGAALPEADRVAGIEAGVCEQSVRCGLNEVPKHVDIREKTRKCDG